MPSTVRSLVVCLLSVLVVHGQTSSPAAASVQDHDSIQTAASLYTQLASIGLDRRRVYRARAVEIDRDALHIDLGDGTIAFTADVMGRVTGAFFEGEGEVLLNPPNTVERKSMALFTGAAILEEKFSTAYFRFNDETFAALKSSLVALENSDDFVSQWNESAKNLAESDAMRLLVTFSQWLPEDGTPPKDTNLPPTDDHMLHGRIQGEKLGVFDVYYDNRVAENISVGQLKTTEGSFYDVWTSFSTRRTDSDHDAAVSADAQHDIRGLVAIPNYSIDATIRPPSSLSAVASLDVEVPEGHPRILVFELSRYLQVSRVTADGQSVEFIHNPSLEGTQLARRGNDIIAVVLPKPLTLGQKLEMRFTYSGEVLSEAGGGLFYVGARGSWYPKHGLQMANFDLRFHYPGQWTLVATGKAADPEGIARTGQSASMLESAPEQVARFITERPIPLAGFNLGRYTKAIAHAGDVEVDCYAASAMERAFPKPPAEAVMGPAPKLFPPFEPPIVVTPPPPSPARYVQPVADRAARAISFLTDRFGPYPYPGLAITQMPGNLSQGWPGLIFLSSFSFLDAQEKAALHLDPLQSILSDQVIVHETAHQWWGDLMSWKSYRDQWMIEGLANYSALMFTETQNPETFLQILDGYRNQLLADSKDGVPLREAGPVTLGSRLSSSIFPDGYDTISYGRGTWLFHMLRNMMRDGELASRPRPKQTPGGAHGEQLDEPFVRALRKTRERYAGKAISITDVLPIFAEELPPTLQYQGRKSLDWFYDGWINGTAIPELRLQNLTFVTKSTYTLVSGTILQKDAPQDLVTAVPLYVANGKASFFLTQVLADGPETSFRVNAPIGTRKILLDPHQTILARTK
jgi:hypothetical protein